MIADANVRLMAEGVKDITLGSMDMVTLNISKMVADYVLESEVKYTRVELNIAGVYLATVWGKYFLKREIRKQFLETTADCTE